MPGTGFLTVGAASTLAFCQVLRDEYPELPCKLNQVRLGLLKPRPSSSGGRDRQDETQLQQITPPPDTDTVHRHCNGIIGGAIGAKVGIKNVSMLQSDLYEDKIALHT